LEKTVTTGKGNGKKTASMSPTRGERKKNGGIGDEGEI